MGTSQFPLCMGVLGARSDSDTHTYFGRIPPSAESGSHEADSRMHYGGDCGEHHNALSARVGRSSCNSVLCAQWVCARKWR